MARKAKAQRQAHNKRTSGKRANATKSNASKNTQKTSPQHKPSKAKMAEIESEREAKREVAKKKANTQDRFKKAGIIAVCVILVVALGLPATIFAFGGGRTVVEEDTTPTVSQTLSKQQRQFLNDTEGFDDFLLVDKDSGVTLTDIYSGTSTPEIAAVENEIEQSGKTPASWVILPDNMTSADDETSATEKTVTETSVDKETSANEETSADEETPANEEASADEE